MSKTYMIYDGRAVLEGTDNATVLEVCFSLDEVREAKDMDIYDGLSPVYSYDDINDNLENEQFVSLLKDIQ